MDNFESENSLTNDEGVERSTLLETLLNRNVVSRIKVHKPEQACHYLKKFIIKKSNCKWTKPFVGCSRRRIFE